MQLKLNVQQTLKALLTQEDTDGDKKITIEDKGPKKFKLTDVKTQQEFDVEGTYALSNLLQELVLALEQNEEIGLIDTQKITMPPIERLSYMISNHFWDGLTRKIDAEGLVQILQDDKSETDKQYLYIPFSDTVSFNYFKNLEANHPKLEVVRLPKDVNPEYVRQLNDKPGLLGLKLEKDKNGLQGVPFVVPGGRFNEMYGWDSYFESIGLLLSGKGHLAKAMADNFQYEIEHYGKILNANRTYYLTRTQPPFYTSLIKEIFEAKIKKADLNWLKSNLTTAIKEYETVWMVKGERLADNGLNRYLAQGIGVTPEAEQGHYHAVLKPYAEKANLSVETFEKKYLNREIESSELDAYFVHDRTVRESGHDTSYRIEGDCAHLNSADLNTFLYQYECDFAYLIKTYFKGNFILNDGRVLNANYWLQKADNRKELMMQYLWNEEAKIFYDYNFVTKSQKKFDSPIGLLPLWAKMISSDKATKIVKQNLDKMTYLGGVAGCSKESLEKFHKNGPARQWDYPYGWAPHQMMLWKGLLNYDLKKEAYNIMYRWLWMITKNAVNYNGTIPEKYDVVIATHKVFAEYGNVGTNFEYITREGFGWMNASYLYGLHLLPKKYYQDLNNLTPPDKISFAD
ncbi:MAG: alpha,alpha-trehalase [Flavobacteriaceae bacterium]